jgi:hypothetical protein
MATIVMADEEIRDVAQVIDARLKELLLEIAKSDDREFRDDLRARHGRLERVKQRLEEALTGDEVYV